MVVKEGVMSKYQCSIIILF